MSREGYLPDEFVTFMNTISTIVRYRDNVKIFMCGNTVNKYSPYFDEMGIKILDMEKGEIRPYAYGDSDRIKIVVEYADSVNKTKDSDIYFAFDNPKLKMIMGGDWELAQYPHFPQQWDKNGNKIRLKPSDILFTYFIQFGEELLQCEIVQYCGDIFTWIHRKTTEIKNPDDDLIYDIEFNPKANYRRRITRPTSDIEKRILDFYTTEKVFYQDNEVGEVVRNYLDWCKTAKNKVKENPGNYCYRGYFLLFYRMF